MNFPLSLYPTWKEWYRAGIDAWVEREHEKWTAMGYIMVDGDWVQKDYHALRMAATEWQG